VQGWPSHHRFVELIGFCARGKSHPVLQTCKVDDHVAELSDLLHDDVDPFLWFIDGKGAVARKIMSDLYDKVMAQNDLRAAGTLYAIASQAAFEVLGLYLRRRDIFNRIAPRRKILPALFSIHPGTAKVVGQMRADSQLGTLTKHARQVGSKAYFISDTPANVYARAIITSVEMNSHLEPISQQQANWAEFDEEEHVRTLILPFPKYVAGLDKFPVPISPASVMQYWRKGKEMIREELPEFHLRTEWANYRRRHYQTGSKTGAVQNAIFKDILAALRTIAGSNQRRPVSREVTR
jgi:hypothetical protein